MFGLKRKERPGLDYSTKDTWEEIHRLEEAGDIEAAIELRCTTSDFGGTIRYLAREIAALKAKK